MVAAGKIYLALAQIERKLWVITRAITNDSEKSLIRGEQPVASRQRIALHPPEAIHIRLASLIVSLCVVASAGVLVCVCIFLCLFVCACVC